MTSPSSPAVLRSVNSPFKRWLMQRAMELLPFVFRMLRRFKPIIRFGNTYLVTRYDDVLEIFGADQAFGVPYKPKLDVIMDGQPFFLGMSDTPQYRADIAAMRKVVRPDDLTGLGDRAEVLAEQIVAESGGKVEVVGLVRDVTFTLLGDYFGIPQPADGDLRVWGTRLFEYQFIADDEPLLAEVATIAPALRAHIDDEIRRRRATPDGKDDVLNRCLAMQAANEEGFSDPQIRTALMGFIVGGPPQPAMVVPQAMEQLLRRREALEGAQAAARTNDDAGLAAHIAEAMRFDPLAPWMPRSALKPWTIAQGLPHQATIPAGAKIMAALASAMRDGRRIRDPEKFDPLRPANAYIHFGHGLHQCFGIHINRATLHRMLKPLLRRSNLARAKGSAGRLRKNGGLAESLTVAFE